MEVRRFDLPARTSTASVREVASKADTEYTLIYTRQTRLDWVHFGLERMLQIAADSGAALAYADHFDDDVPSPVIDYQQGSLRDDFDFGSVLLVSVPALKEAAAGMSESSYKYAGLYDLRLRLSRIGGLVRV
ncbi:MAG: glycosyltransferase family 2 protein, partial [Bacteroidales bacterium]|nr:glycosyltransferase family 2 protein [Bacteroidales bacterium]